MEDKIINWLKTGEDVVELRKAIDYLLKSIYVVNKNNSDATKQIEEFLPQGVVEALISLVESENEVGLRRLIARIDNLSSVKVYLAFEPTAAFLEEVVEIVREKLGVNHILEIVVDGSVMGGVIIETDGKFYDYSIRKVFETKYGNI